MKFNLLPVEIKKARRLRRFNILILSTQILVLLIITASFPFINFLSDITLARSSELTRLISDSRYDLPDTAANEILELETIIKTHDYILTSNNSDSVNRDLLENISIPEGVELISFEAVSNLLTLNCKTENLIFTEGHRKSLEDTGQNPILNGITTQDGFYLYTIIIGTLN